MSVISTGIYILQTTVYTIPHMFCFDLMAFSSNYCQSPSFIRFASFPPDHPLIRRTSATGAVAHHFFIQFICLAFCEFDLFIFLLSPSNLRNQCYQSSFASLPSRLCHHLFLHLFHLRLRDVDTCSRISREGRRVLLRGRPSA